MNGGDLVAPSFHFWLEAQFEEARDQIGEKKNLIVTRSVKTENGVVAHESVETSLELSWQCLTPGPRVQIFHCAHVFARGRLVAVNFRPLLTQRNQPGLPENVLYFPLPANTIVVVVVVVVAVDVLTVFFEVGIVRIGGLLLTTDVGGVDTRIAGSRPRRSHDGSFLLFVEERRRFLRGDKFR